MSFKLSNTYLKLFIMTAAASAMLVGSECLHRLYFDIVPLGRPWEEFLYLLTFTSILCFSRWAFTKVCAAFFLFLCLIVNPVHFEVYQSWINGINYYLALAEWSEVANTGVSMIPSSFLRFSGVLLTFLSLCFSISTPRRFVREKADGRF